MTLDTHDIGALAQPLDMGKGQLKVAVKDCIDIQGAVTACGSAAFTSAPPAPQNAKVVDRILSSDCTIIGKANMHELAYGMTGVNATFGTPINPQWPDRIPGGSSSGSAAAVAGGLCDFAVGTDTGGSVRQPAICCGVYGIKPTYGRISREGCHPKESSLDCVGVFARTAQMLTQAMAVIDPTFTKTHLDSPPKIARVKCNVDKVAGDALIYSMMEDLPDAGYIELPHLEAAFDAGMTIIGAEAARAYGPLVDAGAPLGADVRARLITARNISASEIEAAEATRETFTKEVDAALATYDALITPALPTVPPTLDEARDPAAVLPLTKLLRPFNLSGHPAVVIPMSVGPDHLPSGYQIIGRRGDDAFLCAIAEWMAAALPALQQKDT